MRTCAVDYMPSLYAMFFHVYDSQLMSPYYLNFTLVYQRVCSLIYLGMDFSCLVIVVTKALVLDFMFSLAVLEFNGCLFLLS